MLKKLLLCLGMLTSVPVLASSDVFEDLGSFQDLGSDDVVEIEFATAGETTNPNFTVEFDNEEELAQFRGETSVQNAGFADNLTSMGRSFYKATRNVVAPQYSKEYKQNPTLGKAHGGTHWLMAISTITGIYALKQAYKKAHAEVVAELKEDEKTVSNTELRKAAVKRAWQNIKNTKLADQKLLIGSGAGIIFALAAKALCSFKPAWVGGSKADAEPVKRSRRSGPGLDPTTAEYFRSGPLAKLYSSETESGNFFGSQDDGDY